MLSPLREFLHSHRLILASTSPQRKSIFEQVGFKFDIVPSNFDELSIKLPDYESAYDYVKQIALQKTLTVERSLEEEENDLDKMIIVGADTMIIDGKDVIGKPADREAAINQLTRWRGGTHDVCTGVCILLHNNGTTMRRLFHVVSTVKFANCSDQMIESYVDTGEGSNKAGGYGLQGIAAVLVEGISGDYFNVMGFPIQKFYQELTEMFQLANKS